LINQAFVEVIVQQAKLRAVFMRGGTSKAVLFHRAELPADSAAWAPIFRAVIGSPDPYGRQLDGMGGGVSSVSKVCVVGPPSHPDADVDYTFAQVSVKDGGVDYSGNCGNMSSAIGPFALDEGLVPYPAGTEAIVRIHNTNTGKIITARFAVDSGAAAVDGLMELDGVTGTGAPIRLDFADPGGAKTGRLLPTGNVMDQLDVPGVGTLAASMVDAANPCVFVRAADLGATGTELPDVLEAKPTLLAKLEAVRRAASVAMGLAPNSDAAGFIPSVPKVALVSAPVNSALQSGRTLAANETDILVRMVSIGQPHRAVPLTGALCLAVGCRIPGSVPQSIMSPRNASGDIRIGHPSGVIVVAAEVVADGDGFTVRHGTAYRTARRLFQGEVLYRVSAAQ
jgi:2-methylaconitate cis-trans-isomerase PrpF